MPSWESSSRPDRASGDPSGRGRSLSASVELVPWPCTDGLRDALARAGVALLLLVDPEADPPATLGVLEDWIRLPAQQRDIEARAHRLGRLAERLSGETPMLDEQRVLHREGRTAVLSASEARLADVLLRSAGVTVSRAELEARVWSRDLPVGRSLDALVYRLRSRLAPLGVRVRAVRGRGFVMDVEATTFADDAAPDAVGVEVF